MTKKTSHGEVLSIPSIGSPDRASAAWSLTLTRWTRPNSNSNKWGHHRASYPDASVKIIVNFGYENGVVHKYGEWEVSSFSCSSSDFHQYYPIWIWNNFATCLTRLEEVGAQSAKTPISDDDCVHFSVFRRNISWRAFLWTYSVRTLSSGKMYSWDRRSPTRNQSEKLLKVRPLRNSCVLYSIIACKFVIYF